MLVRIIRWFCIAAPLVAGVALIVFGTAGGISVAFGATLIGVALTVWIWNVFVRMSFAETTREREAVARENQPRSRPVPREAPSTSEPIMDLPVRSEPRRVEREPTPGAPGDPHAAPHRSSTSGSGHGRRRSELRRPRRPS
jgi:hypothetical protein